MEKDCQKGCTVFTGGEIKHDKNCKYYPESRTKMYDDLKAENDELKKGLREAIFMQHIVDRICIEADPAGNKYEYDWTKQFKKLAKLSEADLRETEPYYWKDKNV